jgi:uncharacterized membrane-anchored protein
MEQAVVATFFCVGGFLLAAVIGILLLLYSVGELRQLLINWLDQR